LNEALFGRHAFRKSLANEDPSSARTVINIALFDVCSVLLASVDYGRALECADSVRESFRELISDPDFNHAITYSTNSTRQVRTRFVMASSAISAALE